MSELPEPLNDVAVSVLRVGAARFDENVGHEDFVTLVNTLVDDVRAEERAIAAKAVAAAAPPPVAVAGGRKRVTAEAHAEVARRFAAVEKTPQGYAPAGWKAATAAELGLSVATVTKMLTELRSNA